MSAAIENIVKRIKEAFIQNNLNKSRIYPAEKFNHSEAHLEYLYRNWTHSMSENDNTSEIAIVLFFYLLIIVISIFGNSIVCQTVFRNSRVKSTINLYIENLAVSDLMMTGINIPLQLTEILLRNWPLGLPLCKCLHFMGSLTICGSTLTMTCIALDRFQVTAYPLKPRPSVKSTVHKIILIWMTASVLSSPYAWISDVREDFTLKNMTRCRLMYPDPKVQSRMCFTLVTLTLKFIIPLTVAGITYFRIGVIIWKRRSIGLTTQKTHQREAKWKTIKMLLIVLVVFATCWSPRVIYLAYQDIRGDINYFKKHNSTIWLICHWLAMSSVCFNPFIYCWLNNDFQKAAKKIFKCCFPIGKKKTQEPVTNFQPQSCNEELLLPGSSYNSLNKSSQKSEDIQCEKHLEHFNTKDINSFQTTKILQLSKNVNKVLINPSITISVYIPKENTKTERLQICKGNTQFKKSESRTFV